MVNLVGVGAQHGWPVMSFTPLDVKRYSILVICQIETSEFQYQPSCKHMATSSCGPLCVTWAPNFTKVEYSILNILNKMTSFALLLCGVPQGPSMDPLKLFNVYPFSKPRQVF